MKNLWTITLTLLMTVSLTAQELTADDRLTITQSAKPYIGVYTFGYQGLPTPGYPQFQLNNYGGTPGTGTTTATADNSILGLFSFSGHNGSAKKTVGIIRVKTMTDFAANLSSRMDFLMGPNREQRMTILGDSGNIGMGTDNPSSSLEVYRFGSNAGIEISTENSYPTGNAQLLLKTNGTTADETLLRKWDNSAIGSVTGSSIPINGLSVLRTGMNGGALMLGTVANKPLYLISHDEIGLYMNSSQQIGLGTLTPMSKLDVENEEYDNVIRSQSTYVGNNTKTAVFGESINNPGYGYGGQFTGGSMGLLSIGEGGTHSNTYVYGAFCRANGTAGTRTGVYGLAYNVGGDISYGIKGDGVGALTNYGVYGSVTGAYNNSVNYGVYGTASNTSFGTNWAGYFTKEDEYTSVYIGNSGDSGDTDATGRGLEVNAGYIGIDVNVNEDSKPGFCYGVYTSNATTGTELPGFHYGIYGYASGSRPLFGGNYSIYGAEAADSGIGQGWAGYFAGDVRITGTLDNASDARLKKDIEDIDNALDIIKELQPKTYEFKTGEYPHMMLDERPQLGFVAQDMEKVLPQLVRTAVHPEHVNKNGEDTGIPNSPAVEVKSINYIGIIPVLTQGIKELTKEMEEKDKTIEEMALQMSAMTEKLDKMPAMEEKMEEMSAMINTMNEKFEQMEKSMSSCCLNETNPKGTGKNTNINLNGSDIAELEQNAPNPFHEQTIIKYYIPSSSKNAVLAITDIKGSPLKSVNLESTGLGTVTINANELPVGTYIYTLSIDGKQVKSKQMILVK